MQVTIFGATGMVGRQLIIHCLAKHYKVIAFGRNVSGLIDADLKSDQLTAIQGYVFNDADVKKALTGSQAVLSALGGRFDGQDKARSLGMKKVIQGMVAAGIPRIVALGGLGVLPNAEGGYLLDSPDYPKEYLPVGLEHKAAFEALQASPLDYTFVCSPNITNADANGLFEAHANLPGPSMEISAGNLAAFMTLELEARHFVRQRVGIGNKP